MDGSCYIIGAGDFFGFVRKPGAGDYVIAADAGYKYCLNEGVTPDLVVGDFDSLGAAPDFPNIVQMPVEKDDTDTLHAMRIGLERKYKRFEIYGGTGGARADHTLSNLQCLLFLVKNGARGTLYGNGILYTVIHNESAEFSPESRGDFSVFCFDGQARGVCEEGFKYSLHDAVVTSDFPIGVSNSFTGKPAKISVADGTLILYYQI